MITRRGLLQGIFAAGMAPAICKAEILMPVRKIIVPSKMTETLILWGDGVHDDSKALQAVINGSHVISPDGKPIGRTLDAGTFLIGSTLTFDRHTDMEFLNSRFIAKESFHGPVLSFPEGLDDSRMKPVLYGVWIESSRYR